MLLIIDVSFVFSLFVLFICLLVVLLLLCFFLTMILRVKIIVMKWAALRPTLKNVFVYFFSLLGGDSSYSQNVTISTCFSYCVFLIVFWFHLLMPLTVFVSIQTKLISNRLFFFLSPSANILATRWNKTFKNKEEKKKIILICCRIRNQTHEDVLQ